MKRIMKIMPILIVLVLAFSIIGMSSATAEGTVMTNTQLYIGDYEVDTHSGEAHIVFGQVSDASVEFGVIITDSASKSFLFKGIQSRISADGKYGIAIYDLPDGDYTAQAYSGAEDSRTYGEKVPFTKGVSSYTVLFDANGGVGTYAPQTVAQGGNATKPANAPDPENADLPFLGWTDANGVPFDFTAPVYENKTVYAQYELAGEIVEPVYNVGYTINGGGNYFGNAAGADLTGGKSLVMEWDMLSENFAASNYNIGFFILDSQAVASKNNYPYSVGKSAVWWTNHAYYDYRHLWDGAQSKDAIVSAGAVFHENLFHSYDIFHGVKHFKIVYTSYTATEGASIEIYTKDIGADDSTYKFWSSVTNIPSSAVPAENDVHLHFAVSGGVYNNTLFKLQITNFRYHIEDAVASADVTNNLGIAMGNGVVMQNIYDVVKPTVPGADTTTNNSGIAIVGNKNGSEEGAATLVFNNYFTANDTLAFEVANGKKFEIALDYRCAQVSNSKILLKEEDVNFKYYKVYFDGTYVTLAGRNSEDAVWETVVKRGYQMDKFYIGIRSSSDKATANALFLDCITYVNDGTTYGYTFNNGEMPDGFTVLADTSACVAYVPSDMFTVKYALYDGSVVETQKVGFGMNAVLPEGNWVNEAEALEKATFIDTNTMIMLVREGDNLGGNYVAVENGAISNYGVWSKNFAVFAKGTNATIVADAHAEGYTFKGWQVGDEIVSTDATYTFAVNSNIKLIAKYNVPMHTVTVVNGTIDGIANTTAEIEDGTKITVIANNTAGKVFQGWSDGTEIVSNNKNYSFTVKAGVTLTATYIDAYTVNIDMSEVGGTDTKYIVDSEGHKVAKPDVSDVDVAPINAELGFVTDDGKIWDFDKDVITRDITIYGKWVAVEEFYTKAWKMQGGGGSDPNSALGNAVGVDLSDGSTLNMEFDVFDASIAQANYNQYVWIRTNTDYGAWSNYAMAYSNWAYYNPWPYHGTIAGDNSTTSGNWCPDLIFAKDQSVKISYTAPTADKNGSLIIYTKHIEGTEWSELCYVKDIPESTVTDTKNVFMGIEIEHASSWYKFMNFRMYVNDYEYNIPVIGLNGYLTETENTYVKPVTWQDGREYNVRVNTDAGVDAGGKFDMWFGNGVGVDIDEGESLTWEFTIDSVEYGLWYNCWGGIMVNSGAFPSVCPFGNSIVNSIGWYSNFALDTGNYSGRTATISGTATSGASFATGYNVFDPYTDVTGNYTTGIAPIMIKVVYTSYDKTNNVPGSIVYYKKLKSEGSWTKVTELTGITAELYDNMHISLFYSSTQNAGGAWDFDISNFTYYTSGSKSVVPVIGVGGNGVCKGSLPTYTVKFMNGSSTVSTQKVEEGSLATEQSLSSYTPALGGMYVWVDEDGNVFDFDTSIESDITLYLAQIADPAVKDATWQLTAESKSWAATLGTSVAMNLSDGSTATVEFDVVEGLPKENYDAGFYLWQYLPSNQATDNGYFSGFHDNMFYGNSAYTTSSPNYAGLWKTEDFGTAGYTFGEKFLPHEIFATGKTVKAVYTAPTSETTGSIIIYTKAIGADDSEYAEQASIRNLYVEMVCKTNTTYMGFWFRQSAGLGTDLDMTIENYHIYTANGDVPALYDYNQMVVTNKSVTEELPDNAYTGADTIGNTYEIGYVEGTTTASGWFGSKDGVTLAEDEVLTMEFEVLVAGNKWQNANSGFTVCNIDPSTQTTSPQNFYSLSGVTSFTMYGNWAYDTTSYDGRTARLLGASGATVSGIWDPYTDVAAGDWVKVEYKPYSANSDGYLRVYTKVGANGTYVLNTSVEGITLDLDTDVRIVWFVSAGSGGTNFTHTITNYRMFTSKGTELTNTDSWGGNHAVTVTEA